MSGANGNGRAGTVAGHLSEQWREDARWDGIERPYTAEEVVRLRGSIHVDHTLARLGSEKLWRLLHEVQ